LFVFCNLLKKKKNCIFQVHFFAKIVSFSTHYLLELQAKSHNPQSAPSV
jgi:hypothetical protein